MKRFSTRLPLAVFCTAFMIFAGLNKAGATHVMGGDLSYKCVDTANHVYEVTFNFYRDCAGLPSAPDFVTLNIASSCVASFSATLNQVPCSPSTNGGRLCEVSPLCRSSIDKSTCNGGTLPGDERYIYTGLVTLPETCVDWTMSISIGARNVAITNLLDPGDQNLYIQAVINNVVASYDNSPSFTSLPTPFVCAFQPFAYNHGAVDADGDSLYYSLANPLGAGGIPIGYLFPYSPTNPMSVSGSFGFDNSTGQMNFTPDGVQVAVVAVLVQEFRNGVLIGSTMRDMQVVVINLPQCAAPVPVFSGINKKGVQGGFFIDSTTIQVCPGSLLSFSNSAASRTSDSVFLETNIAQSIPTAQYTVTRNSGDSVTGFFSWTPTGADTGRHTFVVIVKNNSCPLSSSQAYAVTIDVLSGTYAGPDAYYCPSGGPVQLHASGGTQFKWSPTTGLSNSKIANPTASPNQTTTYELTSNLSSTCKSKDTITVFRVPDFNFNLTQSKDTICLNDIALFTINTDAQYAPYTFSWTPSASLNAGNISSPYAQPSSTTDYIVTIRSQNTGCSRKDTARVVVRGKGPLVGLSVDRNNVCKGDTIHLSSIISTVSCGLNTVPCNGNSSQTVVGTDTLHGFNTGTPFLAANTGGRFQMLLRATELQSNGMKPGTIKSIDFDVYSLPATAPYHNFTVRMGCTDKNVLNTFVPGLTQVMFNNAYTNTAKGWNTLTFNNAYNWDGLSNLVIEICFTNNAYSNNDVLNTTATNYNSVVYAAADNQIGCNLSGFVTQVFVSESRPNIRFNYCAAPPPNVTHVWNPTTNLFVPGSLNPFVVVDQTTTYFLTAIDSTCRGAKGIDLNIDTSFGVSAGPDVPFCAGTVVQLNATIKGTPPLVPVNCGQAGTPCGGTVVNKTLNLPGTFSSTNTVFPGDSSNARSQILYIAADLLKAGFVKGTIRKIGFKLTNNNSTVAFQNLNIGLGCTSKLQLESNVWEPTTTAFNTAAYSTLTSWNDFTLQTTFDWDGVSNLVVEVCWNNPDTALQTYSSPMSNQSVNYVAFHSAVRTGIPGCTIPAATSYIRDELPEMRVEMCTPAPKPITYIWTPSTGLSNDTIASPTLSPSHNTIYQVTTYFGGRCPKTDNVSVFQDVIIPSISNDTSICLGQGVRLTAGGGNTYIWQPVTTNLSCDTCQNPIASPVTTTTYYVHITDSTGACNIEDSVTVSVQDLLVTALYTDTLVEEGATIVLAASVTGGSGQYIYLWSPSQYLDSIHSANPKATPLTDINYLLSVTDGPCVDTADIRVHVRITDNFVLMPNAFTPNSDENNPTFGPVIKSGIPATVKSFTIYNRWGQLVHNSTDPWDGKFNNADQPPGTYVYYIVIKGPSQKEFPFHGSVTLLR